MKKKLSIIVVLSMLVLIIFTGCDKSSGETPVNQDIESSDSGYPKLELVCGALDSADTAKAHDLELFMNLVTEKSEGNITFKEYWNASLGKATANIDTIGTGVADIGTVCTLYTPSQLPLSQITYCVPFAPSDPGMAGKLMYEVSKKNPEFYTEYEKNNVVCLAWKGNEPYKLYSKELITSLDQLNGMKMTLGGVYYVPWFESQGAVPVSAPAADLYQTIKTGVASGSFVYDSIYCDFKLYEVEKYCLEIGLGARNCDTICINKDTWNTLDEDTKNLMQECANEAMEEFQSWEKAQMDSWVKEMKDNGVTITSLSKEEKAEMAKEALEYRDTLESWISDVNNAGYDGEKIMSDYLKIGQELGYEWAFDANKYIK